MGLKQIAAIQLEHFRSRLASDHGYQFCSTCLNINCFHFCQLLIAENLFGLDNWQQAIDYFENQCKVVCSARATRVVRLLIQRNTVR